MHKDNDVLSPIDRLPIELLCEVFRFCEEDYGDAWYDDSNTTYKTASAALCSVNNRWRDIALVTPALWTRVRILGRETLVRALLWIERSHHSHLSLQVGLVLARVQEMAMALKYLKPHYDRILTLELDTISTTGFPKKIELLPSLPPKLRYLRFSNVNFHSPAKLRDLLATCKNVVSLDLGSCISQQRWLMWMEIRETREQWIGMPALEELILPANPIAEQVRRFLIAPRLQGVSIAGGCFLAAPPNTLEIRLQSSARREMVDTEFFAHLFALVPEIETLTLHYERHPFKIGNTPYEYALMALDRADRDYPLPAPNLPEETWISDTRARLPHLRPLCLRNVDQASVPPWDVIMSRQSWSKHGRPGREVQPGSVRKVQVEGAGKPANWRRTVYALRESGIDVESAFGSEVGGVEDVATT